MKSGKPVAVLVMGMHRSGTSAVTRVINLLGVELGAGLIGPHEDNPFGFWESAEVVAIHERLLAALEMAWDDPRPLPTYWLRSKAARIAGAEIRRVIEGQFSKSSLWGVKDPRLCRFSPLWGEALERLGIEPRAIIVSRNPVEVAKSLAVRNKLPEGVSEMLWARYTAEAEAGSRKMRRSLVTFEGLLTDWKAVISRIAKELDLRLQINASTSAKVESFLMQSMHHNHAAPPSGSKLSKTLFGALSAKVPSAQALSDFALARDDLERRIKPFLPVVSGLSRMIASERAALATAQRDCGILADSLAQSSAWGQLRDTELLKVTERLSAAMSELSEAVAWGESRNNELLEALRQLESVRAQLLESISWGASRDLELREALARHETISAELAQSISWAESRDEAIREVLATTEALRGELHQAVEWGNSRDSELRKALAVVSELQEKLRLSEQLAQESANEFARSLAASDAARVGLAESVATFVSREEQFRVELDALVEANLKSQSELGRAREDALSQAKELAGSKTTGNELQRELVIANSSRQELHEQLHHVRLGIEALASELSGLRAQEREREMALVSTQAELAMLEAANVKLSRLAASRLDELENAGAAIEFLHEERHRLLQDLQESYTQMQEFRNVIEHELRELRDELKRRVEERDQLLDLANRELRRKQLELDGLQHQANLLNLRLAAVEERLFRGGIANAFRRVVRSVVTASKRGAKVAIIGLVRALPGSPDRKAARLTRLRVLNESRNSGASSRSILADLNQLAEARWPAQPAYNLRSDTDADLPDIDISVVVYRSERWVEGFLASLANCDYPLDKIRLLVRDHSPDSGTRFALEAYFSSQAPGFGGYTYTAGRNVGFGGGHNHNFKLCSGGHFLVCNIDGKFQCDALRKLARAVASSNSRIAAWELRQIPYEHPKYFDPVTMLTSWFSGACVLLRRDAYRAVGGFDDLIFMYGEDVDLSYRLRGRGYQLAYVPAAVFRHDSYDEPAQFKQLQFHGSSLANILLRLRFGGVADMLAIPGMWSELGRSARQQGAYAGFVRNTAKLALLGPLFLLTRNRRGTARIPFSRWDYGLRREGAFEPVTIPEQRPLVSIVVRTYRGRGALLRQALASVANQTYGPVEVLVVEDKGDEMGEVADACARDFGLDVTFIACLDPASNRCMTGNIGMAAARGDFINFLDDDDLLFADHVEFLVSRLLSRDDLGACYSLAWETKIVPDGASERYLEVMHSSLPGQRIPFNRELLKQMNYMPIQSVLFRRELFELYGGLNPYLDNLEDWNLWRRFSWRHDFQMCPKTTSLYHIQNDPLRLQVRQSLLDQYYADAKRESDIACEEIDAKAGGRRTTAAGG